jgi:hypothetical protein
MPRGKYKDGRPEIEFDAFLGHLEPLLPFPGEFIKLADVWTKIQRHYPCRYSWVSANFHKAMDLLAEQGKAEKMCGGTWKMVKQNIKYYVEG